MNKKLAASVLSGFDLTSFGLVEMAVRLMEAAIEELKGEEAGAPSLEATEWVRRFNKGKEAEKCAREYLVLAELQVGLLVKAQEEKGTRCGSRGTP